MERSTSNIEKQGDILDTLSKQNGFDYFQKACKQIENLEYKEAYQTILDGLKIENLGVGARSSS